MINKKIENVKKIAVLRANAIGDFLFALPALNALKDSYPNAELVYLGNGWHKDFLEKRKSPVDRVLKVPPYPGITTGVEASIDKTITEDFFSKMRNEKFDIAIQMHGGGRNSNPFVSKLGARYTVGAYTKDALRLDFNVPYFPYHHEIFRWLEVVSQIGASTDKFVPYIDVTEEDLEEAKTVGKQIDFSKLVILNPGAFDKRRRWLPKYFAEVGDKLSEEGFIIGITGTSKEEFEINEVIRLMKNKPISFYDKLTLGGLSGLYKLSRLVISNDTGPLHLAEAVGTNVIGMMWMAAMLGYGPVTRKNQRILISWRTNCPICGVNVCKYYPFEPKVTDCDHPISFIEEITPEEVLRDARELLITY